MMGREKTAVGHRSLMMVRAVVREEFDDVREETVVNEKSGDAEKKTVKAEEVQGCSRDGGADRGFETPQEQLKC